MRFIWCLCALAFATFSHAAAAPVIDGVMSDEEWSGARVEDMAGGGKVHILRHDGDLYLAVAAANPGIASFCLAKRDRVEVLHASAALGTAAYERTADGWQQREEFDWKVREPAAIAEKKAYFEKRGWLANASTNASVLREYRIRGGDGASRLAIVFLHTDEPMSVARWPTTIDDDCAAIRLAQGYPFSPARFDPAGWAELSSLE